MGVVKVEAQLQVSLLLRNEIDSKMV